MTRNVSVQRPIKKAWNTTSFKIFSRALKYIKKRATLQPCGTIQSGCMCVIHLVTLTWFPIITVLLPALLGNRRTNALLQSCQARQRQRCCSMLSLWRCHGIFKRFHLMMTKCFQHDNFCHMQITVSPVCVCARAHVCINRIKNVSIWRWRKISYQAPKNCAMLTLDHMCSNPSEGRTKCYVYL